MSAILTSVEKAMQRVPLVRDKNDRNVIPPMTHPYGKHWDQPNATGILIDDRYALMSQQSFEALHEYSCTNPTGVYPGKMWRRHDGLHDPRCKPKDYKWLLVWFGYSEKGPDFCSNNYREIIIV